MKDEIQFSKSGREVALAEIASETIKIVVPTKKIEDNAHFNFRAYFSMTNCHKIIEMLFNKTHYRTKGHTMGNNVFWAFSIFEQHVSYGNDEAKPLVSLKETIQRISKRTQRRNCGK